MWHFIYEVKTEDLPPRTQDLYQDIKDQAGRRHEVNYVLKHGHESYVAPHRIAKALDNAANYAMDGKIATHLKDIDPHRTAVLAAALAAGAGAVHLAKKFRKRKH